MNRSELIRKAEKLYKERYKTELERTHLNSFAAIEPESGEYFLGDTLSEASAAARAAYPDRRTFVIALVTAQPLRSEFSINDGHR